jgi:hypothetical protein
VLSLRLLRLDDKARGIYPKDPIGVGKIQFVVNGREIAWVRAADETDPKLRLAGDSNYLVRTVELAAGKKCDLDLC